jgi:hypothetical protein
VFLVEGLGCYAAAWWGGELLFTTKTTKTTKGGVLLCVLSGGTWLLRCRLVGRGSCYSPQRPRRPLRGGFFSVFLVEGLGCYAAAWWGGELLFTTKTTKATKGGVFLCVLSGLSGGNRLLRCRLVGRGSCHLPQRPRRPLRGGVPLGVLSGLSGGNPLLRCRLVGRGVVIHHKDHEDH